ncbi:hypothetical protein ACQ4PT_056440 [Festuca glaucescens]
MATPPETAALIADAWLATPFRAPCPASGDAPWPEEVQQFFDVAPQEMASIPEGSASAPDSTCAMCCLRKGMEFEVPGKKKVWNLTKKETYDLVDGDFLFTPAGDVHRVMYLEDTEEFFIRWDGHWDIFLEEDQETARNAIDAELGVADSDK